VESLIGPFQSSPLSLVPKPGKVAKLRAVHNFLYPHSPSNDTLSINHTIDPDVYSCTWGIFRMICFTIYNLSPGSQASIRDVSKAYRTILIAPEQWPGLVVKLQEQDPYCINTNNNFGLASAGGFTERWLMLVLISSALEELAPYSNGLMTTFSFRFLISTSSFTMLKGIFGVLLSLTMVDNHNLGVVYGTMGRICLSTSPLSLTKMHQAPSEIVVLTLLILTLTLFSLTVMLTLMPFQSNWAYHGDLPKLSRFLMWFLSWVFSRTYQKNS
jgi:hypothetical protein